MNKKNVFKILLIIIFLFIMVLNININTVKARDIDAFDHGIDEPEKLENFGLGDLKEYSKGDTTSDLFKDKIEKVLGFIKNLGIVISVVVLIIIGIKYMLGSVEEKADYKKTMMPYIYGTLFLFAGSFIPQLIYEIVQSVMKN